MSSTGTRLVSNRSPLLVFPLFTPETPLVHLPAPKLTLLSQSRCSSRSLTLRISSPASSSTRPPRSLTRGSSPWPTPSWFWRKETWRFSGSQGKKKRTWFSPCSLSHVTTESISFFFSFDRQRVQGDVSLALKVLFILVYLWRILHPDDKRSEAVLLGIVKGSNLKGLAPKDILSFSPKDWAEAILAGTLQFYLLQDEKG